MKQSDQVEINGVEYFSIDSACQRLQAELQELVQNVMVTVRYDQVYYIRLTDSPFYVETDVSLSVILDGTPARYAHILRRLVHMIAEAKYLK